MLEDLRGRVAPGGVAVDVGAHIGNHTLWMAAICGLDVVAIEPNPQSVAFLRENVALNGLGARVRVLQMAAGAVPGRGAMPRIPAWNTGLGRVHHDPKGPVQVGTIDGLALPAVAVMKIDVEGAEVAVLEGARDTVARCRPLIYVEADGPTRYGALSDWMAAAGYVRFARFAHPTPRYGYAPADVAS